jgi:hypothetical protein
MWYIKVIQSSDYDAYDMQGIQLLNIQINAIYNSIKELCNEDYKILNNQIEQYITKYINNMHQSKIDLIVYNYGIDNAILLLNNNNNVNVNVNAKYMNTSSKALLFNILYSKFNIYYIIENSSIHYFDKDYIVKNIVVIQRFWRNALLHKKMQQKSKFANDVNTLIEKINKEIDGEPAKKILTYLVNKFKRRMSATLH